MASKKGIYDGPRPCNYCLCGVSFRDPMLLGSLSFEVSRNFILINSRPVLSDDTFPILFLVFQNCLDYLRNRGFIIPVGDFLFKDNTTVLIR